MAQHQNQCTDENMELAFREERVPDIFHCLKKSFKKYQYSIFGNGPSTEIREDIFWVAAFELDKKSKTRQINLTSTVNAYFRSFVLNFWKKYYSAGKRNPGYSPLKSLDFFADPEESALISVINAEEMEAFLQAIEEVKKKDEKFSIILQAYMEGKKDREIMEEIGYSKRTGVAVARKRCFKEIREYLMVNFPGLFEFKF